ISNTTDALVRCEIDLNDIAKWGIYGCGVHRCNIDEFLIKGVSVEGAVGIQLGAASAAVSSTYCRIGKGRIEMFDASGGARQVLIGIYLTGWDTNTAGYLKTLTGVSLTAGSNVVTCSGTGGTFSAGMVGKGFYVRYVVGGTVYTLESYVTQYDSPTQIRVAHVALAAASGQVGTVIMG